MKWFVGALIVFVLIRLLPFLWSWMPFGFDAGIYRYGFHLAQSGMPGFESGMGVLLGVLGMLGASLLPHSAGSGFGGQVGSLGLDLMMILGYGLTNLILVGGMAWFLRRKWGIKAAVIGVLFLSFSALQWQAYILMYWKQLLGLGVVMILFALERNWVKGLLWVLICLVSPLEGMFVGVAGVVCMMRTLGWGTKGFLKQVPFYAKATNDRRDDKNGRFLLVVLVLLVGLFGYLFSEYWISAWQLFWMALWNPELLEASVRTGSFISLKSFGLWSAMVLILGSVGLYRNIRKEGLQLWNVYPMVLVLWIVLGMFFYQRVFISLDLMMIVFAASYAAELLEEPLMGFEWGIMSLMSLVVLIPFSVLLSSFQPMISGEELQSIQNYCGSLEEGVVVVATDSRYGSFLRGWCPQQLTVAPLLFEHDIWDAEEWELFWKVPDVVVESLVEVYGDDLSFFQSKNQPQLVFGERFDELGGGWWRL